MRDYSEDNGCDSKEDVALDDAAIDRRIGEVLRQQRKLMGLSQDDIAKALGVSFQQVQKYERGTNKLSASKLYQLARYLHISMETFCEAASPVVGMRGFAESGQDGFGVEMMGGGADLEPILLEKRETIDLIRAYYRILDEKQRKKVLELMKLMAADI